MSRRYYEIQIKLGLRIAEILMNLDIKLFDVCFNKWMCNGTLITYNRYNAFFAVQYLEKITVRRLNIIFLFKEDTKPISSRRQRASSSYKYIISLSTSASLPRNMYVFTVRGRVHGEYHYLYNPPQLHIPGIENPRRIPFSSFPVTDPRGYCFHKNEKNGVISVFPPRNRKRDNTTVGVSHIFTFMVKRQNPIDQLSF